MVEDGVDQVGLPTFIASGECQHDVTLADVLVVSSNDANGESGIDKRLDIDLSPVVPHGAACTDSKSLIRASEPPVAPIEPIAPEHLDDERDGYEHVRTGWYGGKKARSKLKVIYNALSVAITVK